MAHTYEELKKKTVAELRDIAATIQHEAVQGYTQLNKEHLIVALCTALQIPMHEHKKKRQEAIAAGDHAALKVIRREYHHWKHKLRVDARRPEPAN